MIYDHESEKFLILSPDIPLTGDALGAVFGDEIKRQGRHFPWRDFCS
jgi:hypothetical protein